MNKTELNLFSNTGIKENVLNEIRNFAQQCQIEKVILFGSRAKGNYRRTSDIDLAISGGDKISFCSKIEDEIQSLLLFDILDFDKCNHEILSEINKYGKIIYKKKS